MSGQVLPQVALVSVVLLPVVTQKQAGVLAVTVGAQVLGDRNTLSGLRLLPLRDLVAVGVWIAGFAGNTIVWRGEHFSLKNGKLHNVDSQRAS